MDLGPRGGKTTDSVPVCPCGSNASSGFILALQICGLPPTPLHRQFFLEPPDKHTSADRLPVWRWRMGGRDRARLSQGNQSSVCDQRIYIHSFAGILWKNRSLSRPVLGSDSNEAILGGEASHPHVFVEMEDAGFRLLDTKII